MESNEINVYCDESCHLQNDGQKVMGFGSIWCPKNKRLQICKDIRAIKHNFGIKERAEIKWTKVSPSKINFYEKLIEYFFNSNDLRFRALIIPDKNKLNHHEYNHTHDDFYYIMYYYTLKHFLRNEESYNIYIDIKDTKSWEKTSNLKYWLLKYFKNKNYYFNEKCFIKKVQLVRSHETELMQLTDLLLGAIVYKNRGIYKSPTKFSLVEKIEHFNKYPLNRKSLYGDSKFNIFIWDGGNR